MRIIINITGILLIVTSIWCFINSGIPFAGVAFILGLVMVIHGGISMLGYIIVESIRKSSSWMLSEGIATVSLGAIVLANQIITDEIALTFFGLWVIFAGSLRITDGIHLLSLGDKNGRWAMLMGFVSILLGIYCFFNTAFFAWPTVVIIGVLFIMMGANTLTVGVLMPAKALALIQQELLLMEERADRAEEEMRHLFKMDKNRSSDAPADKAETAEAETAEPVITAAAEPEPEAEAEPEPEAAAEPEFSTAAEPVPVTAAEQEPETTTEPVSKTEAEPEQEPETTEEPQAETIPAETETAEPVITAAAETAESVIDAAAEAAPESEPASPAAEEKPAEAPAPAAPAPAKSADSEYFYDPAEIAKRATMWLDKRDVERALRRRSGSDSEND